MRRHTLKIGKALRNDAGVSLAIATPAIAITLDPTFIRSCEEGKQHLEVRVGNVETEAGGRQVFGAVAKADTDVKVVICQSLTLSGEPKTRC